MPELVNKKVFVKTQGCQMNEYDSAQMLNMLETARGMEATDNIDEADIILLNTCSIREKAQEKVFSELGRWHQRKRKKPDLMIGVGGCVASQEGEAIIKRAPYVDVVFGPQTLHRLPELIDNVLKTGKASIDIEFPEIEKFDKLPEPKADGPSALVSIMEGCSKYCTYCVVPYTRGTEISRPFDDVIAEVVGLVEKGVKVITFLGQNVNDYQGKMHDGNTADLALLIQYTAEIEGVERIRFTTSHPAAFSDSLIETYAQIPKLSNHLHLPVQSGSNKILAAMKRGYTREMFIKKMEKLRKIRPDITIGTDIIVGFPGETDKDFQDTLDLAHEINFDQSYSFVYSPRPGTPAVKLNDPTPISVKKERLKILQDRLNLQKTRISQSIVGSTQQVLVEKIAGKDAAELMGKSENGRFVNFVSDNTALIGQFVDVYITSASTHSLRGEIR